MKRFSLVWFLFVLAATGSLPALASAQDPPEFFKHYRVLPRLSVLHETGGFAGIDRLYRLKGDYDFQHGLGWTAQASFENAAIEGSLLSVKPTTNDKLDVDQLLNLEGLQGEALPVAAPFDVYKFTGETADGSSVRLLASVIGPWMYVRGGTRAPVGSADYFEYDLRKVARSRPFADFNDDGVVDAADYTVLRNSGNLAGGSAAGSIDVTAGAGYAEWKEQFGEAVPDFSVMDTMLDGAAGAGAASVVPEPASIGMAFVGGLLLASVLRPSRRLTLPSPLLTRFRVERHMLHVLKATSS